MVESAWRGPVAAAATVTTVAQFMAGTLVCKTFIKRGTTGDESGFQFVCGLLSCSLWLRYGWMRTDDTMVLVNAIGCFLQFMYTIIYYKYVGKKTVFTYQVLGVLTTIATVYLYTMYETDKTLSVNRMGFITCFVTLLFVGAPLTMLLHVLRVKSTESLPFPVIFMSLIVSGLWYLYGTIIDDTFVIVPNAIGVVLAAMQLILFFIYPRTQQKLPYAKLSQVM